jgi:hypothetical protein
MQRPINRLTPQLPAHAMKTYAIVAPRETHFRAATCAEFQCDGHTRGWQSRIDETTELGQKQAHYIRKQSGRRFIETCEAGLTVFDFEAGQQCFRSDRHLMPVGRPELYLVRDGDWRGNPRGTSAVQHKRPEEWVDDFANHQQKLADRLQQG